MQPKRQGQGSPQKNLGTILAKPFPIPKCFGSQKISAKISGKTKRGLYLLVEFLEGQSEKYRGKHFGCCIYWSDLLGKCSGLG